MTIAAHVLNAGEAAGPILVLDDPLSFWGAFDPATGIILDANHPQRGACLKDTILVLPATRGSGGTPGGIAEAIRLGTAPAGIVLMQDDVNLAIGAAVAAALYARHCPVLRVDEADYARLARARRARINADGAISLEQP